MRTIKYRVDHKLEEADVPTSTVKTITDENIDDADHGSDFEIEQEIAKSRGSKRARMATGILGVVLAAVLCFWATA